MLPHIVDGIFEVMEADLFRFVRFAVQSAAHGVVDGADVVKHRLVGGLHTIRQKSIVPDLLCLIFADELADHIRKAVSLSL